METKILYFAIGCILSLSMFYMVLKTQNSPSAQRFVVIGLFFCVVFTGIMGIIMVF